MDCHGALSTRGTHCTWYLVHLPGTFYKATGAHTHGKTTTTLRNSHCSQKSGNLLDQKRKEKKKGGGARERQKRQKRGKKRGEMKTWSTKDSSCRGGCRGAPPPAHPTSDKIKRQRQKTGTLYLVYLFSVGAKNRYSSSLKATEKLSQQHRRKEKKNHQPWEKTFFRPKYFSHRFRPRQTAHYSYV